MRFGLVGVWNTVFGYVCFLALLWVAERVGAHYLVALLATHVIAVSQAFVLHRAFVYPDGDRGLGALARFASVYTSMLVVNVVVLPVLVEGLGLPPSLGQLGFLAASTVASFFAHRGFTFRVGRG